jgi:hypothetical protein
MKTSTYSIATIFAFIFLTAAIGCNSYTQTLKHTRKNKKYVIMHSGVDVYIVKQVEVERNRKQFTVYLDRVDSLNIVNTGNPEGKRYVPKKGEPVKPEIHVYMKDSTSYTLDEPHTIAVDKIARIEKVD